MVSSASLLASTMRPSPSSTITESGRSSSSARNSASVCRRFRMLSLSRSDNVVEWYHVANCSAMISTPANTPITTVTVVAEMSPNHVSPCGEPHGDHHGHVHDQQPRQRRAGVAHHAAAGQSGGHADTAKPRTQHGHETARRRVGCRNHRRGVRRVGDCQQHRTGEQVRCAPENG